MSQNKSSNNIMNMGGIVKNTRQKFLKIIKANDHEEYHIRLVELLNISVHGFLRNKMFGKGIIIYVSSMHSYIHPSDKDTEDKINEYGFEDPYIDKIEVLRVLLERIAERIIAFSESETEKVLDIHDVVLKFIKEIKEEYGYDKKSR